MSGALRTAKPACSTFGLCSALCVRDAFEHLAADLEAVADLRRLRQIEQRAREHRVLDVEIDAADQVRRILALREPARRGARRAVIGEREHRRAARRRLAKRIGVDRHEQVRLHAPRFAARARRAEHRSRRCASASRACRHRALASACGRSRARRSFRTCRGGRSRRGPRRRGPGSIATVMRRVGALRAAVFGASPRGAPRLPARRRGIGACRRAPGRAAPSADRRQ